MTRCWPLCSRVSRRIDQGYFRDVFPTVISALGYLRGWGKIQFYLKVKSLPVDNPKPPSGPIMDPTIGVDASGRNGSPPALAFARYCFTSKLYCGSQSSSYCPPHLQSLPCCNTIAQLLRNIRPPTAPPLCMPYTIDYW